MLSVAEIDTVEFLLEAKADPNLYGPAGRTPLMVAAAGAECGWNVGGMRVRVCEGLR